MKNHLTAIAALFSRSTLTTRHGRRARRPLGEALEQRRLLTVTASVDATGGLQIQISGTDTAVIADNPFASGPSNVIVKDASGNTVFTGPAANTITGITVTPGGTSDAVDLTQVGASPDFTKLATVTVNAGTGMQVLVSGTITASGDQTYDAAVNLQGTTSLASTAGHLILAGTVDGAFSLSTSGAATSFEGDVGKSAALAGLSTAGAVDLNASLIDTSGAQLYQSAVTLTTDTTLISSGAGVQFFNTVDGAHSLTITSAVRTDFDGDVGELTPLTSLTVDGAGRTHFGANIGTTGNQTFQQAVELDANASLTTIGGNVTFASTIDGNSDSLAQFALSIDTTGGGTAASFGQTHFDANVGSNTPLSTLTVTTGGPLVISHLITTVSNQLLSVVGSSAASPAEDVAVAAGAAMASTTGMIELRAVGNVTIAAGSNVTATAITLRGDFDNAGPNGGTLLLAGSLNAPTVNVFTGNNNDVVNLATTLANTTTTVTTGSGTDTINISSAAPSLSGVLSTIAGAVNINGGGGLTALNVGDGGDQAGSFGSLTSNKIFDLGMPGGLSAGITYSNVQQIALQLSTAANESLLIESTAPGTNVSVMGGNTISVFGGTAGLDQILGSVSVNGASSLSLKDELNAAGHTYDVTSTFVERISASSEAATLATAGDPVTLSYANIGALNINGGTQNNIFNIFLPLPSGTTLHINGGSGSDNDLNLIGSDAATNNAAVGDFGSSDPIQAENVDCLTMYGALNQSNIFVNQTSISSILIGGMMNDTLLGGSGPDVLFGGSGTDLLVAGGTAGSPGTDFTFANLLPAYLPSGMINPNVLNPAVYPNYPGTKFINGGGGVVVSGPGSAVANASMVFTLDCDLPGSRMALQTIFNQALASNMCLATLTSPPAAPAGVTSFAEVASFSSYINQAFEDVLGRPADDAALAYWSGQLAGGLSRAAFANTLTHSGEYYQRFVAATYSKYLGRSPDAGGLAFWASQMQQGLSDATLEADLIGSAEYFARAGGTDRAWVDALYHDVLGRAADQQGESYWIAQLQSGVSRTTAAYRLLTSAEHEAQIITADYQHYLGRLPAASEVNYWIGQFESGATNEDLIAGFIASDEYVARAG